MEEKKWTDEQIIDCLECLVKDGVWEGGVVRIKDILDFINRQKAEIERLTEELEIEKHNHKATQWYLDNSFNEGVRLLGENEELKKQVDELKAFKNEAISMSLYGKGRKDGEEVAVKDTAKEILAEIGKEACEHAYLNCDCEWFDKICKKYGVEVE